MYLLLFNEFFSYWANMKSQRIFKAVQLNMQILSSPI